MALTIIFAILTLIVAVFLLNFSVYYPIILAYNLSTKGKWLIILALSLLSFSMLFGEGLRRVWGIYWLSTVGMVIIGFFSIAITVMAINLLLYLLVILFQSYLPYTPAKIFAVTTTISLILIPLLSSFAVWNNHRQPKIKHYSLQSDKIVESTEGLKIILISELHLIGTSSLKKLNRTIELINNQQPDLVIIGGDLIDEPWERIKHLAASFISLKATYGVYSVSGNHDYYSKHQSYTNFLGAAQINDLDNHNVQLLEGLTLAGISDPASEKAGLGIPDPAKAFAGVDENDFIIFVSHQPVYYKEGAAADLILSGHTHRGQIPPMNLLVALTYKYHYGLFKPSPDKYIYTTSGVSIWGPPMRLFTSNEIVVFTLKGH